MIPRIGFGYDLHRLEEGQDLTLGGKRIEHYKGTVGHSDADVLIHAIIDSLLGATALGDIGAHFPDEDPRYKGASSSGLLKEVVQLLHEKRYQIGNIDSTLCIQKPRMKPYIQDIVGYLSEILGVDASQVSVKATTNEKVDAVGREEAVVAYATALVFAPKGTDK